VSRPRVLVAEDDASVRMTLQFVLEDEGFDVIMAEDGEQAVAVAREERPDVILLDGMLPKLEGREVYSALRGDASTKEIPVLVLSGMVREQDDWPGAHFVGKPFSPDELIRRIHDVLLG
jgi:two-component system phosphate regulon response regulator PhoB